MAQNKASLALGSALCCVLLASPAWAEKQDEDGFYIGSQYSVFELGINGFDTKTINPHAANAQIGYQFNRYIGLEARAGYGLGDDAIGNSGITAEIENYYGGYLTLTLPVTPYVHLYGLVGQTDIKTRARNTVQMNGQAVELTPSSQDENISYGGGIKTAPFYGVSFNLEFFHAIEDADAISAGISYQF